MVFGVYNHYITITKIQGDLWQSVPMKLTSKDMLKTLWLKSALSRMYLFLTFGYMNCLKFELPYVAICKHNTLLKNLWKHYRNFIHKATTIHKLVTLVPVTTAWRVPGLRIEETASRYSCEYDGKSKSKDTFKKRIYCKYT